MVDFLHPSVSSVITDNSTVFVTAQGQTMLFAAFQAGQGPDNRPVLMTTPSQFNFTYGEPNMRAYGQTAYNVVRWLGAGGVALCCRVLPYMEVDGSGNPLQQSLYACYILEVGTKTVGGAKTTKVRVRTLGDGASGALPSSTELGIRTDVSINALLLATPTVAASDGYMYYPIFVLRGNCRGAFYNAFGITIELMTSQDASYNQRTYQITVFSSPSTVAESFVFSTYPDAVNASQISQFLPDVLSTYSSYLVCDYSDANYTAVCTFINPDPTVEAKLDIFTLQERNVQVPETLHAGVTLNSASQSLIPTSPTCLLLGGGTDGTWSGPNSLISLLYKAYSGSGDFIDVDGNNTYDTHFGDIWDKRSYPIDVTLDANYDVSVKVAMSNFSSTRGDLVSLVDTGITGSPAQALALRQSSLSLNTFFTTIFTQDFIVADGIQGYDINVTSTYFLADKIPTVDSAYGIQWPFVGPRRGGVTGYKSISWKPDDTYMESLYTAQVNYVECSPQQAAFMSQVTSQQMNSALSDLSHVRALLRIRRQLEAIGGGYRFQFNDPTTWAQLQYDCNNALQGWISNRALRSGTATVYASAYDIQSRIVRITAAIVFEGLIERVMIDIVVNN